MTSKLLYIAILSALFLVPLFLYRSRRRFMTRFYFLMTAVPTARKLYHRMLLIVILAFHFIHLNVVHQDYGIIISTTLMVAFFVFMNVDMWLHALKENRRVSSRTVILILLLVFTPYMFTTAVTFAFIFVAAQFYPSRLILLLWEDKGMRKTLVDHHDLLSEYYY